MTELFEGGKIPLAVEGLHLPSEVPKALRDLEQGLALGRAPTTLRMDVISIESTHQIRLWVFDTNTKGIAIY